MLLEILWVSMISENYVVKKLILSHGKVIGIYLENGA